MQSSTNQVRRPTCRHLRDRNVTASGVTRLWTSASSRIRVGEYRLTTPPLAPISRQLTPLVDRGAVCILDAAADPTGSSVLCHSN
ncbi:MAG: hypothetical protein N3G20_10070, partial [Verrucomicrobiae bacterium]|nr:hypothetical protein [Verrucomicrobiae bacterium]